MRALLPLATAVVTLGTVAGSAVGYEFEIGARTTAQAYQLRFSEFGRLLNRRRFTQTLSLDVWGILEPTFDPGRADPPPLAPFDVYLTARLRLDHDFGDYTRGTQRYTVAAREVEEAAVTAVPELAAGDLALEVLELHAGARGILDRIDLAVGRQVFVDALDWYALDGLAVTARLPGHVQVFAHGGFLVRDASPLGSATQEPDGTGSAQCTVIADPSSPQASITDSDCAGRDRPAPTFGVGVGTHGLRWLSARLSYRRSISSTDDALVPGLAAAAPAWGVLEEKLSLSVRGNLGGGTLVPWAAARWNFLLALADEVSAGVRLRLGDHAVTPELRWSYPSFDGDSIFNVFSAEPVLDLRLGYDVWPGGGRLKLGARGYWRRYGQSDLDMLAPGATIDEPPISAGGLVSAGLRAGDLIARLDLGYEDGQGGLRAGGDLSGRLRLTRRLFVDGRASLIRFEDDLRPERAANTFGMQAGARFVLGPGMSLHFLAEENANRYDRSLRLLALLDLAFRPEH